MAPNTVVTLHMELHDAQNQPIRTEESLSYLHGSPCGLFEGLEAALEGRHAGETVRVQLEPEQAFGDYDAGLVRLAPRSRYGAGLEVGMEIEDDFGSGEPRRYSVTDLAEDQLVLDANHPLAGIALRFTCRILAVRPATAKEIARGDVDRPLQQCGKAGKPPAPEI